MPVSCLRPARGGRLSTQKQLRYVRRERLAPQPCARDRASPARVIAHPIAPADADDDEPIPVPQLDALPWTVRWMCAGAAEASGMVEAVARAADAQPLFGALEVRALGRVGGKCACPM